MLEKSMHHLDILNSLPTSIKLLLRDRTWVFSDLVGDSVVAFYKQFRQFGITANDIIIGTPITTEQETAAMGPEKCPGSFDFIQLFPICGHAGKIKSL